MAEDLPKLKNDRQLPTGDFLDLIGGLFLKMKMEGGLQTGREHQNNWGMQLGPRGSGQFQSVFHIFIYRITFHRFVFWSCDQRLF